jgi:hypothetical protein
MYEKRRYERVAWFCPVLLKVMPAGPMLSANTFDISLGGVGVTADRMVERGETVTIRFHMHDGAQHVVEEDVLGRVAYSRADEDGDRIGIEFLEKIRESAQPLLTKKLNHLSGDK